mmetsp:Transcript_37749/g.122039  ORF Transcript_37749/g.122039 Transcript_37749/m.122039 type:complete len:387 (+) Transcript_37749:469-1629(+)
MLTPAACSDAITATLTSSTSIGARARGWRPGLICRAKCEASGGGWTDGASDDAPGVGSVPPAVPPAVPPFTAPTVPPLAAPAVLPFGRRQTSLRLRKRSSPSRSDSDAPAGPLGVVPAVIAAAAAVEEEAAAAVAMEDSARHCVHSAAPSQDAPCAASLAAPSSHGVGAFISAIPAIPILLGVGGSSPRARALASTALRARAARAASSSAAAELETVAWAAWKSAWSASCCRMTPSSLSRTSAPSRCFAANSAASFWGWSPSRMQSRAGPFRVPTSSITTGSSSSLSRPPPRAGLTLLAAASRSAAALRATADAAAAACFFAPCRTRLFAKLGPFPLDEIHASSVRELARGGGGSGQSGGGRGGDAAAVAGVGRAALGGGGRPVAR